MIRTLVTSNPAWLAMRALALPLLDRVEWRHHGIGVLQGYVREHCEPEIRLHIWSSLLLKPGMHLSGDAHDHRFDMVSHVLFGSVEHEEMTPTPHPEGDHAMMALTHARAAADTNYNGPTSALEGRFAVSRYRTTIRAGYSYQFPAQCFHRSPLSGSGDEVAVTCIEKHGQADTPSRLLYPRELPPVMAFGHEPSELLIRHVVDLARERLEARP